MHMENLGEAVILMLSQALASWIGYSNDAVVLPRSEHSLVVGYGTCLYRYNDQALNPQATMKREP